MKKNKQQEQILSPHAYITTKLKNLPMQCYINKKITDTDTDTQNSWVLRTVTAVRAMSNNKFCIGVFLMDTCCLGLKNTTYEFALTQAQMEIFLENLFQGYQSFTKIDNADAHNLICGAIDYAEELGFKPNKDWSITEHFLNPDLINDNIDDVTFGFQGRPYFVQGPYENVAYIIQTLNRTVGEGNYNYIIKG